MSCLLQDVTNDITNNAGLMKCGTNSNVIENHPKPSINKRAMAEHFSTAAANYDDYAEVQKHIAEVNLVLLKKLVGSLSTEREFLPSLAVDLGCGTGIHTKHVAALSARCLAVDISQGMLKAAQKTNVDVKTAENKHLQFCAGDAEALPLQSESIDILHSSMVLQWCHSPKQVITEVKRVLSSKGKAQLAIMLDSSLHELRDAWKRLGIEPRINDFCSENDWLSSMPSDKQFEIDFHTQRFQEWHTGSLGMLRALKRIGAATKQILEPSSVETCAQPIGKKPIGKNPIGKKELVSLDQVMHKQSGRSKASYALSYDVLFISIKKC